MHLFLVFLLLSTVRGQQQSCSCSCCSGQFCVPTSMPAIPVSNCTLSSCHAQCQATYAQCRYSYPNGQLSAQCSLTSTPQYKCRCECCNTGSVSCAPTYVGDALSFSCQGGSCSITCANQYPYQCVANQNGQTIGTCVGLVTTTTTTTSVGPWLGNTCACYCCQTNSMCSPQYVGTTSASSCSSTACTQACRNQYTSSCPSSSYIGQTNGVCTSGSGSNIRCSCQCFGTNGRIDYQINTNGDCSTCSSLCQNQAPCTSPYQTTSACIVNNAKMAHRYSSTLLILTMFFFNHLN